MSIKTLKEMMGMEAESTIAYPLPQLDTDALDAVGNIQKYTASKMVLEHPEVNATLKQMNAFDTLNKFSVEPSYEMAQWVVEALREYYGEDETAYYNEFPFLAEHSELSEFGKEFLAELGDMRMAGAPDISAGMPADDNGWMDKLAAKFGFHDIGFKEMMWLYIMNQAKQGFEKPDVEPNAMDLPADPVVTEAVFSSIDEEPPVGLVEWVKTLTEGFTDYYGKKWGDHLFTLVEHEVEQYRKAKAEQDVVVEQDDAGLESGMYNDTRPAPKPSAKVKADVKQRIGELAEIIADDKKKKKFYGDVKPSVYNAKEALEKIMDFLNAGTMEGYKQAQIHLQKLMSPITNLFPPTLIKFLAYANDGEDSKVMKPVGD